MEKFAVVATLLLASAASHAGDSQCSAWAQRIVGGATDACSDLCPQARQIDRYDYRAGLQAAFASRTGLEQFLAYLGRSSIIGAGAEAHACSVRALLEHWGDERFAASLDKQSIQAKEQAIGLLDYTAIEDFQSSFPKTYRLASHE